MSDWYTAAAADAAGHPTIVALRESAHRHREMSLANFQIKGQSEADAESLEVTALYLEAEMVAKAGVLSGEFRAVSVGHNAEVGRYIRVETDQGWNPDYFWCETPLEVSPLSGI